MNHQTSFQRATICSKSSLLGIHIQKAPGQSSECKFNLRQKTLPRPLLLKGKKQQILLCKKLSTAMKSQTGYTPSYFLDHASSVNAVKQNLTHFIKTLTIKHVCVL